MSSIKTPLYKRIISTSIVVILASTQLTGCLTTIGGRDYRCRGYDYCAYTDAPRQYVRAPDGNGGRECLKNPMEC
jgi:predicted small secreted protein